MNAVQVVWLCVGLTGIVCLLAITIGLFRQVQRLGRAVLDFSNEVRPTLEELRSETEQAQEHSDQVARKADAIRAGRERARR